MERVFFIPAVVEVCGCRHLGFGGPSSGAVNQLGLVATHPSAARGLGGRARVGDASACVLESTFGGGEGSRSRCGAAKQGLRRLMCHFRSRT